MMQVIHESGARPIKIWTDTVEDSAMEQLRSLARMSFIASNGVAVMPDVHAGIGSTVGSVIATKGAVIPAAVGVDIGCGMNAIRTSLTATQLPDSLLAIRHQIERDIPLGAGGRYQSRTHDARWAPLHDRFFALTQKHNALSTKTHPLFQLGTLGSGNHFIEICLDESQQVWIMLHSGSRGIGNLIGRIFIEKAKKLMERYFINLPDADLAFLSAGTTEFDDYIEAMTWAQEYAFENRAAMLDNVISALRRHLPEFNLTNEAINCHHNYCTLENHFNANLYVTRKGAVSAREGQLGIIPGSMGVKSFIVRGKGNPDSYHSCSHGAGRRMSRTQAKKEFTVADLEAQTRGVECLKTVGVLDEIPGAYKDIDTVMSNQADLVEIVHTLKQVICVKGT